jgi:hypothetical protein
MQTLSLLVTIAGFCRYLENFDVNKVACPAIWVWRGELIFVQPVLKAAHRPWIENV